MKKFLTALFLACLFSGSVYANEHEEKHDDAATTEEHKDHGDHKEHDGHGEEKAH
jgi:hypothetical protein